MNSAATPLPAFRANPGDATVYVHPGRTAVSKDSVSMTTVVGSGLAICVWDPHHNVGGMAHYLLPEAGGAPPAPRYGDVAMRLLVDDLVKSGAKESSLRARFYGGSAPPIDSQSGHIGDRNVAVAMAFLKERSIPIVDKDIGGVGARKILFNPRDGSIELVRIRPPS